MPFCPKCKYEYKAGVFKCPDCDVELVASLPPEERSSAEFPAEYKDWVQVARLTSNEYSEMLQEGLRAKQIPAVILSGTGHFGQTGQMGTDLYRAVGGGYSLFVPREHVADACAEAEQMLGEIWQVALLIDPQQFR
jgi:hypothetical protein